MPQTGSGWLDGGKGHDEDSDDKIIDGWGETYKRGGGGGGGNQRGGNPSNRACLPILVALAGGLAAAAYGLIEAAHRVL